MSPRLPLAAACAGAALTGAMTVTTRYLVEAGWDPVSLSVHRNAIAGGCLAVAALLFARQRLPRRDLLIALGLGGLFFSLFPVTLATAIQWTTASRAAVILSVMPVFTLLVAVVIGQEAFRPNKLVGGLTALLGVALVMAPTLSGGSATLRGDLLMLLVAFMGATFNTLLRPVLQRHNPVLLTSLFIGGGLVLMGAWGTATGQLTTYADAPAVDWWVLIASGTLAGALPMWLFYWALGRLEASVTTVTMGLTPVAAVWMGVVLLGEPLTPWLLAGMVVVLGGILVANRPRPAHEVYTGARDGAAATPGIRPPGAD